MQTRIKKLREYFKKQEVIMMGFLFGSRAKGIKREFSDWDIAVYFKPYQYCELETTDEYPEEQKIREDVERILGSENVDFLVLNRARPPLVFSVLNCGIPLLVKNKKLYLKLLIKTHYEAVDYWNFTKEFFEIGERAKSLSAEDIAILRQLIRFLENEFGDLGKLKDMSQREYVQDSDKRRNIERLIENLVMAAIDIAKIILASEKREIPQTYRETLLHFALKFMEEKKAREFSQFADLRNIVVYEYLDIKWEKIKKFVAEAPGVYPLIIKKAKGFL